jgi:hypothetical protein
MKSSCLFQTLLILFFLNGSILIAQQVVKPVRPSNPQSSMSTQNESDPVWKKVDSLANQGLPQSALKLVSEIMQRSYSEGNYPQYIKANLYELKLRAQFEEEFLKNYIHEREQLLRVDQLSTRAKGLKEPIPQILHSILADLYWQYYSQNRYVILDRTVLSGDPGKGGVDDAPIETWDINKFIQAVSYHYNASLQNPSLLQSTQISEIEPVIEKAPSSAAFRPTLFDFLAHRAVDFFINSEASITKPVHQYVMKDSALLLPADKFISIDLESLDSLSFDLQALQIMQQLIRFHLADKNPEALVDADLKRLYFVYNTINYPRRDSLYLNTLLSLEKKYSGQPVSAPVIQKIAEYYYSEPTPPVRILKSETGGGSITPKEQDLVKAREWCLKAINEFPETPAAKNCSKLLKIIEEPLLEFQTYNEVSPDKEFPLLLNYKNVKKIWLRLVPSDYITNREYHSDRENKLRKYLAIKPLIDWTVEIPVNTDYQKHSAELIIPEVKSGRYILMINNSESFTESDTTLAYGFIQVSNITYISRNAPDGAGLVYVLNRNDGKPLKDVEVQSFTMNYDYRSRTYTRKNLAQYKTGANGSFSIKAPGAKENANLSFEFRHKGDTLVAENYFALYNRSRFVDREPRISTFFFTDRAIYRPGQPVYFKGIVIDNARNANKIVQQHKSTVNLYDVNGQKVSSVDVTSGEYGSFSNSFVIPSAGLTGGMRIESESGSVYFNVEEYKRPRFEVTFEPIDSTYRLSAEVEITGEVKSYSDVPLSGATVNYRVVRSVMFPFFRYTSRIWPPFNIPDAEIANGIITVDEQGNFKVRFTAVPDPADYGNKDPFYTYTIYADATDINGETQSAQTTVNVSNKALILDTDVPLEVNISDWKPFTVKSTNLSGRKVPATVKIELHKLKEGDLLVPREWDIPDTAFYTRDEFKTRLPHFPYMNEIERNNPWSQTPENALTIREKLVHSSTINTATDSIVNFKDLKTEPGRYLLLLTSTDAFGTPVETEKQLTIFDPASNKIPAPEHLWFTILNPEPAQGEKIRFLAGSAVNGRLLIEIRNKGKILKHDWYPISNQKQFEFDLPDSLTGQVNLLASLVYHNHNFTEQHDFTIPDKSKELNFTFETFRSPLLPGSTEKWKIKISGPEGKPLQAELLASMYDASLDAFMKHNWNFSLYQPWQQNYTWELQQTFLTSGSLSVPRKYYGEPYIEQEYDKLNWFGYNNYNQYGGQIGFRGSAKGGRVTTMNGEVAVQESVDMVEISQQEVPPATDGLLASAEQTDQPIQIRRNLQETAFFYPHLTTNKDGEVWVEFTVPEALTRWNFMGLAHTPELRNAQFTKEVVTRKELMVTPNLPRFFRDGDKMVIRTKVSNLTANPIQGEAQLEILDAMTMQPVNDAFNNTQPVQSFSIEQKGSTSVNWSINIPANIAAVMVRVTAKAGNYSDGEEVMLPVLTNRMLVTETKPLPINGNETKEFNFTSLTQSDASTSNKPAGAGGNATASTTRKNHRLTLEYTSNPAWYAVQALPWLESREKENADQLFNRFYANSIAGHIANSSPKIRNVFELWKTASPDALLSNLEKNQELKALVIEETPWLMDAKNESEQKQRIALMFDLNRLSTQRSSALRKLKVTQSVNGGWPWFEGMPESRYITQLIVSGMGKLHYLKVNDLKEDNESRQMVQQAVNYLSTRLNEDYRKILRDSGLNDSVNNKTKSKTNRSPQTNTSSKGIDTDHLGYEHIQFLYALSYLNGIASPTEDAAEAVSYFSNQARKYWNNKNLYAQGMIAIWAGRSGDINTTRSIMASLREKAVTSEEIGMYWRDNTGGYLWYQAPVETQVLMIELFEEFGAKSGKSGSNTGEPTADQNKRDVDQMKTWLLKQKQTQSWPTSTATAEAVYALLLRGTDWLQTDASVKISLGNKTIDLANDPDIETEPGTGYFKTSWSGEEISPAMGNITVSKASDGPAWGAVYLQYFENLDKIRSAQSPLSISKQLFIRENTDEGQRLAEITEQQPLSIGDNVTVRVEITSDRNLEFVHLKDMRAAAFEPATTLSGYEWKGGLGYYRSTRDAATNFFFYYLPKGTHVFEYQLIVAQEGQFSNGISTIQCMYAPEFAAHSEGNRITVKGE